MARLPAGFGACLSGVLLCTAMAATAAEGAAPAEARQPEAYPQISRELRIGADVLRAALAEAMPEHRRVLGVDAGFLAGQGVLVIVEVATPWFRGRSIDVPSEITSLEHIPEMVQDILSEMNLGLSHHQAEDLKELRAIRDAERRVRAEQRAIRSELRDKRRQLLRADDATAAALRREVEALNQDLAAAEEEERALEADAATLRDSISVPPEREADVQAPASLDQAVVESVCGYGATFRSLADDQRLNVLVQQPRSTRYYVFRMADVRQCQSGGLTPEALLAKSFAYDA